MTVGSDSPVRSIMKLLDRLPGSSQEGAPVVAGSDSTADVEDLITLHYGSKVVLRGLYGRYLAARQVPQGGGAEPPPVQNQNQQPHFTSVPFYVQADGIGTGASAETLILVNASFRDDRGAVRFGDTISLRSRFARERFLSLTPSGELQFARVHIGLVEKWVLLRPGDVRSREFVRAGDSVLLQHSSSGMHLALHEDSELGLRLSCVQADQFAPDLLYNVWQMTLSGIPYSPGWNTSRPYLSGLHLLDPDRLEAAALFRGATPPPVSLASLEPAAQEQLLIDDVLAALMGTEGRYIKMRAPMSDGSEACFVLELEGRSTEGEGLSFLVERLLPLCDCYVRVNAFVCERGRYDYGMVAHALAAAMRVLLREYLVLVAQLETQLRKGGLSLQKLWFYLQPTLRTMERLDVVAASASDLVGGALLNRLREESACGGDEASQSLMRFLIQRAGAPYLEMLGSWIYDGQLADPYGEFMVRGEDTLNKDAVREDFNAQYWESCYTIQEDKTLSILWAQADKILTTGKYLNVVRECGKSPDCPYKAPIPADDGAVGPSGLYVDIVQRAYDYASEALLDLILQESSLMARLRSIKHYFLLDQGDFFVHFMQVAGSELRKEVTQISANRLESLLHLSVQTSSANSDPFKDDLSLEFSSYNLINHLNLIHTRSDAGGGGERISSAPMGSSSGLRGIDSIMVTYRVSWPLSLVISKRAITKYQLLFRHLFFAKHVERMLLHTWLDHQECKELALGSIMVPTFRLRQRMLHFMQNFVYYMCFEVIEPRWHELEAALQRVGTVDDVLQCHGEFQDTCLKECLLTNQDLLKILTKLMTVCQFFADNMQKFARTNLVDHEAMADAALSGDTAESGQAATPPMGSSVGIRRRRIAIQSAHVQAALSSEAYRSQIATFDKHFDDFLHQFMRRLWSDSHTQYHSHLTHLATRLDYNGYLSRCFETGLNAKT
jgi:gamma-tubulin complex component 2